MIEGTGVEPPRLLANFGVPTLRTHAISVSELLDSVRSTFLFVLFVVSVKFIVVAYFRILFL